MAKNFAVNTTGLREFRRDLKRIGPELDKELRVELREAVNTVAAQAAATAPRKTGRLAASYRPFVNLRTGGVRSRLPYAGVIEYGGTIRPRGTDITIRRYAPITRAVEQQTERIVEQFGDAVDRAAHRAGW